MKKIVLTVFALALLVCPAISQAAGTGFYAAPKFLMTFQNTGTLSKSNSLGGSDVEEYDQFTLGGALALGLDFWTQQMFPLRVELEFALRGNSTKSWEGAGVNFNSVKGTWNNSTLFANVFWDFRNDSPLTPYIGGGLGLAFNYTGYDFTTVDGDRFSRNESKTNFAWNVGAGVSYDLNEMVSVDASYRFVGLGYNEVSGQANGRYFEISNEPYNNEIMLGLRFNF